MVVVIIQEQNNLVDKYSRLLDYLVLKDGRVLNEIMIKESFAKPYNKVFCEMLQCIKNGIYKLKTVKKDFIQL